MFLASRAAESSFKFIGWEAFVSAAFCLQLYPVGRSWECRRTRRSLLVLALEFVRAGIVAGEQRIALVVSLAAAALHFGVLGDLPPRPRRRCVGPFGQRDDLAIVGDV